MGSRHFTEISGARSNYNSEEGTPKGRYKFLIIVLASVKMTVQ
jgi:hypothetical protein